MDKLGLNAWPSVGNEEIYFFIYSVIFYEGIGACGTMIGNYFLSIGEIEGTVAYVEWEVRQITSEFSGCFLNVFIFSLNKSTIFGPIFSIDF